MMKTFSFIKHSKRWFAISSILCIASLVAIFGLGLRFGIDFTGGSLMEVAFDARPSVEEVTTSLEAAGYDGFVLQPSGEHELIVRTASLTEEEHQALLSVIQDAHGEVDELRFDSIGPVIGGELRRNATIGVFITLLLIGLYVAWAFRKVSRPVQSWKYGLLTILAAFHDVLIAVGAFALLGHFYSWEIGSAFIAAALTILGYSINDTVVVFDRTRENLSNNVGETFEETVDLSIKQTFRRSLNTSITTLLALLAIFVFGGDSTRPFALALMIGIGVGTYSSLFLASPLLVAWFRRSQQA